MTREELLKIAKPILFNTDMTKAILEDRKTATRRICKDGNKCTVPDMSFFDAEKRTYAVHNYADAENIEKLSIAERKCPICPSDILYVRETWQQGYDVDENGEILEYPEKYIYAASVEHSKRKYIFWKPSIHMPKEAARIFLKVKDVRVERLQDITEDGIQKEGVIVSRDECVSEIDYVTELYFHFQRLWDTTVLKADIDRYGWEANPWVWVIEFERIKPDTEV